MRLAHAPGDQLRVLGSEVDDEDEIVCGIAPLGRRSLAPGHDQRPMPMFCARCSDLPSVSSDGAIITSAFWNSFTVS